MEVAIQRVAAADILLIVASVLMESNLDMQADYIRALLNYSAKQYGDSDEYGNGVIDLEYAIEINDKFKNRKKTKEELGEKEFNVYAVATYFYCFENILCM